MSPEAQSAAQYMAQHNWLRDGVAWEQVAAVIDRESASAARRDALQRLVHEIAAQKPEKPDYWTSCGQCERNTDQAREVLELSVQ